MDMFDLSGEVAAVVGGTGVLGGEIASGLAAAGAVVAVLGRREAQGRQRVDAITKAGGSAAFVYCDATERDSVEHAQAETTARFGEVTVLVNAAGGNSPNVTVTDQTPVESIALEDWEDSFRMNVVAGALLPCQIFGSAMVRANGGSIINIASVAAHTPLSRVVAYSSAKAAVINLTKFLAREWAEQGVRVNSITPGFFPAEQNHRLLYEDDGSPTPRTVTILDHTPMKRFGSPEELVGAAVFLASRRASSFVTGSDLVVDGGFLTQAI